MNVLITKELADQRRGELLRQAERARRAAEARAARPAPAGRATAPRAWRAAAGRVLVRSGVLLSGTALDDSIVVVRSRARPTRIAILWSDRPAPRRAPSQIDACAGSDGHPARR